MPRHMDSLIENIMGANIARLLKMDFPRKCQGWNMRNPPSGAQSERRRVDEWYTKSLQKLLFLEDEVCLLNQRKVMSLDSCLRWKLSGITIADLRADNAEIENADLRAELAQEKAASAELREALERIVNYIIKSEQYGGYDGPVCIEFPDDDLINSLKQSLSSDAGKSLLEEVERMRELRPAVRWFAGQMERVLKDNDGRKTGWLDCDSYWLMDQINIQMRQLDRAMRDHQDFKWVIKQCCDIANFAMMIADKHRAKEGD